METLTTIAVVLATLAMIFIVAGLIFARQRRKHVPFMLAAFACDIIGLVLVEFGPLLYGETDAVSSLAKEPGVMKSVHAALATVSVVAYVFQIISGKKILKGDRTALPGHQKMARVFILTRLAAYITMFLLD